jgi:hypothetical protein
MIYRDTGDVERHVIDPSYHCHDGSYNRARDLAARTFEADRTAQVEMAVDGLYRMFDREAILGASPAFSLTRRILDEQRNKRNERTKMTVMTENDTPGKSRSVYVNLDAAELVCPGKIRETFAKAARDEIDYQEGILADEIDRLDDEIRALSHERMRARKTLIALNYDE